MDYEEIKKFFGEEYDEEHHECKKFFNSTLYELISLFGYDIKDGENLHIFTDRVNKHDDKCKLEVYSFNKNVDGIHYKEGFTLKYSRGFKINVEFIGDGEEQNFSILDENNQVGIFIKYKFDKNKINNHDIDEPFVNFSINVASNDFSIPYRYVLNQNADNSFCIIEGLNDKKFFIKRKYVNLSFEEYVEYIYQFLNNIEFIKIDTRIQYAINLLIPYIKNNLDISAFLDEDVINCYIKMYEVRKQKELQEEIKKIQLRIDEKYKEKFETLYNLKENLKAVKKMN